MARWQVGLRESLELAGRLASAEEGRGRGRRGRERVMLAARQGHSGTLDRGGEIGARNRHRQGGPRPYFESGEASGLRGRLLLITWHFPPGRSAGALRWQKLATHAVEHGWGVDVIALDPGEVPDPDPARLRRLPAGLRAFGVRAPTLPADRFQRCVWRVRRAVRSRLAGIGRPGAAMPSGSRTKEADDRREPSSGGPAARAPDLWREVLRTAVTPRAWSRAWWAWRNHAQGGAWADRATALGERLTREVAFDAIVTSGPPHMAHEAGRKIRRRTGLPLIMDLRDPWSLPRRLPADHDSPVWFALARRYERRCVRTASLVIVNTDPVREAMATVYPSRADRFLTVMNGCDEEPIPPPRSGDRFLVAYAGGIYLDRDPRPLFRAAARVVDELGLDPDAFAIELMGDVESFRGLPLRAIAAEEGVARYVRTHPPRPREEMLRFLAGAAVLVSLPQDSPYAVPSKIFEYMRFPAWLLILAPSGSATAGLLEPTSAEVVDPTDVGKIASALRSWYRAYRNGGRPSPVASNGIFDRRSQAKRLFDALDDVVGLTA